MPFAESPARGATCSIIRAAVPAGPSASLRLGGPPSGTKDRPYDRPRSAARRVQKDRPYGRTGVAAARPADRARRQTDSLQAPPMAASRVAAGGRSANHRESETDARDAETTVPSPTAPMIREPRDVAAAVRSRPRCPGPARTGAPAEPALRGPSAPTSGDRRSWEGGVPSRGSTTRPRARAAHIHYRHRAHPTARR